MSPKANSWLCAMAGMVLLHAASVGAQEAYKWTDANGTVHYTQQPPPKGVATAHMKISQSGATSSSVDPVGAKAGAANELKEANVRQSKHMCEVARSNLEMLKGGGMITSGDDITSAKQLDADQRQQAVATAQADIDRYCHEK